MNENQIRDLLKESIENTLNDFYHERIVPLEKQIIKLGGTVKKNPDEIELKLVINKFFTAFLIALSSFNGIMSFLMALV